MATHAPKTAIQTPAEDWTVVLPRRLRAGGKHRRGSTEKPSPKNLTPEDEQPTLLWTPFDFSSAAEPSTVAKILHKVRASMTKLESSRFFRRFLSQLHGHPAHKSHLSRWSDPGAQMVVYGVGSIEAYEPPRLQLAFAILLRKELGFSTKVEVFDPVLSVAECMVIEELGCKVLSVDERGRRAVTGPTLFYMPHCEASMYNNLLQANWRVAALNQMVVLGNSFTEYENYVTGIGKWSRVEGEAQFVVKASRIAKEIRIDREENCKEVVENKAVNDNELVKDDDDVVLLAAFNLTSWHFFHCDDDAINRE